MNNSSFPYLVRSMAIISIYFLYSDAKSEAKPDAFIPKPTAVNFVSAKPVNNGTTPEGDFTFEVDAGPKAKNKPIPNEQRITLKEDFDATNIYYKIGNANVNALTLPVPSGAGTATQGTGDKGLITDPVQWSDYTVIIGNVEVYWDNAPGSGGPLQDGSWYAGAHKEITFVDLGKFNKRYWLNDPLNGDQGSAKSPLCVSPQEIGVTVVWPANVGANSQPTATTTYASGN